MKALKFAKTAMATVALLVGTAQASPVVTHWSVTDFAWFDPASVLPAGNVLPNPVLGDPVLVPFFGLQDTSLVWSGSDNPAGAQSGIKITAPNALNTIILPTGAAPMTTISVTHDNFTIPLGTGPLTSVTIPALLIIDQVAPASTGDPEAGLFSFSIKFVETVNAGVAGVCADGGTPGVGINSAGCADIFVILPPTSADFILPWDSNGGGTTGADPLFYQVNFFGTGFGVLSNAACAAAGVAAGCEGFLTREGQATTADFMISINLIPEPGSLALVGASLSLMALVGRRRSKKLG